MIGDRELHTALVHVTPRVSSSARSPGFPLRSRGNDEHKITRGNSRETARRQRLPNTHGTHRDEDQPIIETQRNIAATGPGDKSRWTP